MTARLPDVSRWAGRLAIARALALARPGALLRGASRSTSSALQLGSKRNAIYKNLFDARRNLRKSMAAAGHPVIARDAVG
jgi:hypothetical protein